MIERQHKSRLPRSAERTGPGQAEAPTRWPSHSGWAVVATAATHQGLDNGARKGRHRLQAAIPLQPSPGLAATTCSGAQARPERVTSYSFEPDGALSRASKTGTRHPAPFARPGIGPHPAMRGLCDQRLTKCLMGPDAPYRWRLPLPRTLIRATTLWSMTPGCRRPLSPFRPFLLKILHSKRHPPTNVLQIGVFDRRRLGSSFRGYLPIFSRHHIGRTW